MSDRPCPDRSVRQLSPDTSLRSSPSPRVPVAPGDRISTRPVYPPPRPLHQPLLGHRDGTRSGANSAKGSTTNRRSHMRGWGTTRSSSSTTSHRRGARRRPRCAGPTAPPAGAGVGLEPSGHLEQLPGTELGVELDHQVQKGALARRSTHGLGLVQARHPHHVGQSRHGPPELGSAVTEVGAESEKGTHGRRSPAPVDADPGRRSPRSRGAGQLAQDTTVTASTRRSSSTPAAMAPARDSSSRRGGPVMTATAASTAAA